MGAAEGPAYWRKCRSGHGRRPCPTGESACWPLSLVVSRLSSERLSARRLCGIVSDEDEECRVFHDLLPLDGTLFLVMPKEPIIELSEAGDSGECLLGHVMIVGEMCVAHLGLTNGFRMVVDEWPKGGQSVYRIHVPILGGWPPG